MAEQDTPEAPLKLGKWLEGLRLASGISVRALAQAVDADRKNVRAWLKDEAGMTGKNFFLFLSAVGAKIEPAPPRTAPKALNAEIAEVRRHLQSLEAKVANLPTAADLQSATSTLQAAIDQLANGGTSEAQRDRP